MVHHHDDDDGDDGDDDEAEEEEEEDEDEEEEQISMTIKEYWQHLAAKDLVLCRLRLCELCPYSPWACGTLHDTSCAGILACSIGTSAWGWSFGVDFAPF